MNAVGRTLASFGAKMAINEALGNGSSPKGVGRLQVPYVWEDRVGSKSFPPLRELGFFLVSVPFWGPGSLKNKFQAYLNIKLRSSTCTGGQRESRFLA